MHRPARRYIVAMVWVNYSNERYCVGRHPSLGLLVIPGDQLDGTHDEVLVYVVTRQAFGKFQKVVLMERLVVSGISGAQIRPRSIRSLPSAP